MLNNNSDVPFHLRPATEHDVSFSKSLYLEVAQTALDRAGLWGPEDAAYYAGRFDAVFKLEEAEIIVVEDEVVGFVHVTENETELYLQQLHLVSGYRGRGIGRWIMERFIVDARSANKTPALSVLKGNPIIDWYLSMGFKILSEDHNKYNLALQRGG